MRIGPTHWNFVRIVAMMMLKERTAEELGALLRIRDLRTVQGLIVALRDVGVAYSVGGGPGTDTAEVWKANVTPFEFGDHRPRKGRAHVPRIPAEADMEQAVRLAEGWILSNPRVVVRRVVPKKVYSRSPSTD